MADQSPDYKRLFLEEQTRRQAAERAQQEEHRLRQEEHRLRQEAERSQQEEHRLRQEAERAQHEEHRLRHEAESRTRKTTLAEFLDGCHEYLHANLRIETDASLSTKGAVTDANRRLRPNRILQWKNFPKQQLVNWRRLMKSKFVNERLFISLHTLSEHGNAIKVRKMASETDLHLYQRPAVEDHTSSIIEQLFMEPTLRKQFHLKGSIKFENHANTLSPTAQLDQNMSEMNVSRGRRRSPRIQAKTQQENTDTANLSQQALSLAHPRADQFCVYNIADDPHAQEHRVAAFITEYKAPHKLTLGYIYEGLEEMELDDVLCLGDVDTAKDRFRRLIAAVITQCFSYMVQGGLKYGCICTGEATIFLQVPEDPTTVYYFLSVPKGDVGESTGWTPALLEPNRLHLTAVGQLLAFTLSALQARPRSLNWRRMAMAKLNTWEIIYDELVESIPTEDTPSSVYRQPKDISYLRASPIRLRKRRIESGPCFRSPVNGADFSNDEMDPDTPSRPSSSGRPMVSMPSMTSTKQSQPPKQRKGQAMEYCTQKCLLGLVQQGPLDQKCPNSQKHGQHRHAISHQAFLSKIRAQLAEDLDTNFRQLGIHGATGALFQVRLALYGYTFVAKGVPSCFAGKLYHEVAIYRKSLAIQGLHIPVQLGNTVLDFPYFYDGIAQITRLMFLSYGGISIGRYIPPAIETHLLSRVEQSYIALHSCGVLQGDASPRNLLWNEETGNIMAIDFERATIIQPRLVLGPISTNRKRKRTVHGQSQKEPARLNPFKQELLRAVTETRQILQGR